jgi:hypothetical protein
VDQLFDEAAAVGGRDWWFFDESDQSYGMAKFDVRVRHREHGIQRQYDAVVVTETGDMMIAISVHRAVMRSSMRVDERVVVTVRPGRLMDVLHRRQREDRDRQTEQYRQERLAH